MGCGRLDLWRGSHGVLDRGAGHSATKSHGPLSDSAGCSQTAEHSACVCDLAHDRVARDRSQLHQFTRHRAMGGLATLKAARFKGRYIPPSESAIRRALQRSDADALDRILSALMAEYGVPDAIACNGKTPPGLRQ